MPTHDNEPAMDEKLKALFAAAGDPEDTDAPQFLRGVMKRIHRRERLRWLILGASVVAGSFLAMPALLEFSAAFGTIDFNAAEAIRGALNELAASASAYARSAAGLATLATAAVLAVVVVPLLRWLAD